MGELRLYTFFSEIQTTKIKEKAKKIGFFLDQIQNKDYTWRKKNLNGSFDLFLFLFYFY